MFSTIRSSIINKNSSTNREIINSTRESNT